MFSRKMVLQACYLPVLCAFLVFPLSSQGCAMSEIQLVQQILLKPIDNTPVTEQDELSVEYLDYLRSSLGTESKVALDYVRPMSMGVHVLKVEPPMSQEGAVALTDKLSRLDDVEYAEPDFPRRRR
uniref:Uncharacterized protein n=1 Tax=uncultured Thiotrichaceae bacterium TaxID=298394 RepID=A0A6S6ULQ8_9GAMM|nr:MAG: Unknown protein [uncultured Thiotrichaceae bacterium]